MEFFFNGEANIGEISHKKSRLYPENPNILKISDYPSLTATENKGSYFFFWSILLWFYGFSGISGLARYF